MMSVQAEVSSNKGLFLGIVIGLVVGLSVGFGVSSLRQPAGKQMAMVKDLGVNNPESVPADLYGYISTVNGSAPPEPRDKEHAVAVPAGQDAVLEGWFACGNGPAAVAMDDVFGTVDGKLVKATMVKRPDVSKWANNPNLLNAGYRLKIDSELLQGGPKRIDMLGKVASTGTLHRFYQPIYLVLR
jgi:hypothetical protein